MALERGGVFFVTDPPPSFDFGIDCFSYETKSDFRGICMIPAGFHIIYWSTGIGSRQGYFIPFEKDEVVVKSWDSVVEDLLPVHNLSDWSLSNLLAAISRGELDPHLGPYPLEIYKSWTNLSNYITSSSLSLVGIPPHTLILPGDLQDAHSPEEKNLQALQPYFPNSARIAQYCDIKSFERQFLQSNQFENGSQVTQFHLDRSELLGYLLTHHYKTWENLLAELQISFLLFMLIFSYPSLEHWKSLVNLISSSERVLLQHPQFTCGFLRAFYEQLHYSPDDFFETEISSNNFLRPILSSLFDNLGGALDEHVREHRNRLLIFTQKKFNIYQEDSRVSGMDKYILVEEDMPVIVGDQELSDLEKYREGDPSAKSQGSNTEKIPGPPPQTNTSDNIALQEGLFSWRYPLLYEEMVRHNDQATVSREDLVMTSMRIIDEMEPSEGLKHLHDEAVRFLENEVSLWGRTE